MTNDGGGRSGTAQDAAAGEDWPAVGAAITARMRERRMSQQALATASGVSVATLRELQRGTSRRRAHDSTLVAISRALGWPDDHLLVVLLGKPPEALPSRPVPVDQQILEVLLRIERSVEAIGARLAVPVGDGAGRQEQRHGHGDGPDPVTR